MTLETLLPTAPSVGTTGDLARWLTAQGFRTRDGRAIRTWMVRRMFELGLIEEARPRLGTYRLVSRDFVPVVVAALRQAGYISAGPAETF